MKFVKIVILLCLCLTFVSFADDCSRGDGECCCSGKTTNGCCPGGFSSDCCGCDCEPGSPSPCCSNICPDDDDDDDDDDEPTCGDNSCSETYTDSCICPPNPASPFQRFRDYNNNNVMDSVTITDSCEYCEPQTSCSVDCGLTSQPTDYCTLKYCNAECIDLASALPAEQDPDGYRRYDLPGQCGNYALDCSSCCGCEYRPGNLEAHVRGTCDVDNDQVYISGFNDYCGEITVTFPWPIDMWGGQYELVVSSKNVSEPFRFAAFVPRDTPDGTYVIQLHGSRNDDKDPKDEGVYNCDTSVTVRVMNDYCQCPPAERDNAETTQRFYDHNENTAFDNMITDGRLCVPTDYCMLGTCNAECVDVTTDPANPYRTRDVIAQCGPYADDCATCCECLYHPSSVSIRAGDLCPDGTQTLSVSGFNEYCGDLTVVTPFGVRKIHGPVSTTQPAIASDYELEFEVPAGYPAGIYTVYVDGSRQYDTFEYDEGPFNCHAEATFEIYYEDGNTLWPSLTNAAYNVDGTPYPVESLDSRLRVCRDDTTIVKQLTGETERIFITFDNSDNLEIAREDNALGVGDVLLKVRQSSEAVDTRVLIWVNANQRCRDIDGYDPWVRGYVKTMDGEITYDVCEDGDTVREYICSGGERETVTIDCEQGCIEGQCVSGGTLGEVDCADRQDNDGDGKYDCQDHDCCIRDVCAGHPACVAEPCMGTQHCTFGGSTYFEYCGDCAGLGCSSLGYACRDPRYTCETYGERIFYFDDAYPVPCELIVEE